MGGVPGTGDVSSGKNRVEFALRTIALVWRQERMS